MIRSWVFRGFPAAVVCLCFLAAGSSAAQAPRSWSETETKRALAAARSLLGTSYEFGGRKGGPDGGIDCLGVIFAALEAATGCGWKSYAVSMTDAFVRSEFGPFVPGFAPVRSKEAKLEQLRPGDLLFFAGPVNNPGEPSAGKVGDVELWVAHTGMFTGEGRFIVGDHYAGKTIETDLRAYISDHPYPYLFAVRPVAAPNVRRCRAPKPPLASAEKRAQGR